MSTIVEITGEEVTSVEERRAIIADSGLNALAASVGLDSDLNDGLAYTIDNMYDELVQYADKGWYTYNEGDDELTVLTEKLVDKNKYKTIGTSTTRVLDTNAEPDQDIIDYIVNHKDKEDLVIKALCGIKFADLLFDHVITTGTVPVANCIILFGNYCFITAPFLASFEEEEIFLTAFGDAIAETPTPRFFIKDY